MTLFGDGLSNHCIFSTRLLLKAGSGIWSAFRRVLLDGWISGGVDGWMERERERMEGGMGTKSNGQVDKWIEGTMYKWMNGLMGG